MSDWQPLNAPTDSMGATGPIGSAGPTGPVADPDADFPPGAKLGAAALTVFAPFLSLAAALTLRSGERRPARRASLNTWAVASGAWLVLGLIIAIVAFAAIAHTAAKMQPSTAGPCEGGPEMGSTGEPLGNGRYRFPCEFGGTTVVNLGNN